MTRAHKLFKTNDITWSEALKLSWKLYKEQKNININTVYKDYYKRIRMQALKIVKNQDVADDVTNDVFIRFNRNLENGNFDARQSSVNTYLNHALKSAISDYYRREKNHNNTIKVSDFYDAETGKEYIQLESDSQADTEIESTEIKELIYTAMNDLSEMQKEIANLFFINDLSYNDIADILNISLESVKVNIHRVRKILQNNTKLQKLHSEM